MKQIILIFTLSVIFITPVFSQTFTYKSNKWGNTKLYKKWATACDNPTYEKVIIMKSSKMIKATFGKKTLVYNIESEDRTKPNQISYNVKMDTKRYIIKIMDLGGMYHIICDNEWAVIEISDRTESE